MPETYFVAPPAPDFVEELIHNLREGSRILAPEAGAGTVAALAALGPAGWAAGLVIGTTAIVAWIGLGDSTRFDQVLALREWMRTHQRLPLQRVGRIMAHAADQLQRHLREFGQNPDDRPGPVPSPGEVNRAELRQLAHVTAVIDQWMLAHHSLVHLPITREWARLLASVQELAQDLGTELNDDRALHHFLRAHVIPELHRRLDRDIRTVHRDLQEFRHHLEERELPAIRHDVRVDHHINVVQTEQLAQTATALVALKQGLQAVNQDLDQCVRPNCSVINQLAKWWRVLEAFVLPFGWMALAEKLIGMVGASPGQLIGLLDGAAEAVVGGG